MYFIRIFFFILDLFDLLYFGFFKGKWVFVILIVECSVCRIFRIIFWGIFLFNGLIIFLGVVLLFRGNCCIFVCMVGYLVGVLVIMDIIFMYIVGFRDIIYRWKVSFMFFVLCWVFLVGRLVFLVKKRVIGLR